MTKAPSTKAIRRKRHVSLERAAAREHLDYLMTRDDGRCHWCNAAVIRMKTIPVSRRLSCVRGKLRYVTEAGTVASDLIATVDHLQRRADGGSSCSANLVLSCLPCNWARDREARGAKRKEAA